MKRILSVLSVIVLAVTIVLFSPSVSNAAALSGAIFTTDVACDGTNVNIFDNKSDVYVDGGPHHLGSAGLPEGNYYIKVTIPSGATVLGSSGASAPVVVDSTGSFVNCYQLASVVKSGTSGFTTLGYDDTTNGGGVYKVWVCSDAAFTICKTDNFKVKASAQAQTGSISGIKWEDLNADGNMDSNELGLADWTINITGPNSFSDSTTTDSNGFYIFSGLAAGTYSVCEVIPANWFPSFPATSDPNCYSAVILASGADLTGNNFGNYQLANLKVIKHVINDNGGGALAGDFTMNVTATNPSDDSFLGDESGTTITIKPGSYSAGETAMTGYAQINPDADCIGTATSGQTIECTITNDDIAPSLTLDKIVINDNGGLQNESAWTLTANGGLAGTLSGPGAAGSTDVVSGVTFKAGTYALSESGPAGYTASLWTCTGDVTNSGASIILAIGQSAVCHITNNDDPPTRTQGYWSTHLTQSLSKWPTSGLDITICGKTVSAGTSAINGSPLMGGFWSSISKKTNGNRTALDQAKMQLVQQYLAAVLNKSAFGTSDGGLLLAARTACSSNDKNAILSSAGALGAFNSSGDSTPFPSTFVNTAANSTGAQKAANKGYWDNL